MFRDRKHAARLLAVRLKNRPMIDPLVLGIPRGGVICGAILAEELGADLDVVLTRKLGAPYQPELALGAVAENGQVYLNPEIEEYTRELGDYLEEERQRELAVIERRKQTLRVVRPQASVTGRTVIVTDDGIATGSTMVAALQAVRAEGAHELIAAVPVAPPSSLERLRPWCDDLICLHAPEDFWAVGQFYEDFTAVEDEEVLEILQRFTPQAHGAEPARS